MLMLDATTSLRTGVSASASRRTAVPTEFADVYSAISYIDCPTPTRAARWTTASTPSSARLTTAGSRTSPTTSGSTPAAPSCTCGTRLSSTRTRSPFARNSSARCEPMKPAPPVMRTCSDSSGCREPGGCAQRVGLVGPLPREVAVVAAEVAVRRRLRIDRPAQVEVAQDRRGAQVEMLLDERLDLQRRDLLRPERLHEHRHRMRDTDRVRDLDLAAVGEACGDDVLRHVARRIRGRAVDLRRVLARERATAVRRGAAVGVDDDLAARQTGVAHRAADDELAGRVAIEEVLRLEAPRVVQLLREDRLEHVRDEIRLHQHLDVDSLAVLRRDDDALDLDGAPVPMLVLLVAHRHLRLAVRTQIEELLRLADRGEPLRKPVRKHDRQRHQLLGLTRRVAEHHPLVAGADAVERVVVAVLRLVRLLDTLRDVGRLLVDGDHDPARVGDEACRDERLAGHTRVRILREDGIENGVGDLVGDLVRVTLGDRLGGERQVPDG